jgi:4-carboxymuconolactone decarboxylase
MTNQPGNGPYNDLMPRLGELTRELVYVDIWERPGLSKRDRSLITIASLTALYRTNQIRSHMRRALANGVTKEEIGEVLMHMAFYAGWPCAVNAFEVAKEVFDQG